MLSIIVIHNFQPWFCLVNLYHIPLVLAASTVLLSLSIWYPQLWISTSSISGLVYRKAYVGNLDFYCQLWCFLDFFLPAFSGRTLNNQTHNIGDDLCTTNQSRDLTNHVRFISRAPHCRAATLQESCGSTCCRRASAWQPEDGSIVAFGEETALKQSFSSPFNCQNYFLEVFPHQFQDRSNGTRLIVSSFPIL